MLSIVRLKTIPQTYSLGIEMRQSSLKIPLRTDVLKPHNESNSSFETYSRDIPKQNISTFKRVELVTRRNVYNIA